MLEQVNKVNPCCYLISFAICKYQLEFYMEQFTEFRVFFQGLEIFIGNFTRNPFH